MSEPALAHGADCGCTRCRGFERGHRLSARHGFYLTRLDEHERAEIAELVDALRELSPAAGPSLEPLLELTATQMWRLRRAIADIAENGLIRAGGSPAPILGHLQALETRLAENFERLAITPKAAAELNLQLLQTDRFELDRLTPGERDELRVLLSKGTGRG